MPRTRESQLSLSVRQEDSGAMRMLLRAAYSLTHEPESSFFYMTIERLDRNIYVIINQSTSAIRLKTSIHSITTRFTTISQIPLFPMEKTMHRLLPAVDGSTAGVSLLLDLEQIHYIFARTFFKEKRRRFSSMLSRADRTGLSRPSTLYSSFKEHLALSS